MAGIRHLETEVTWYAEEIKIQEKNLVAAKNKVVEVERLVEDAKRKLGDFKRQLEAAKSEEAREKAKVTKK